MLSGPAETLSFSWEPLLLDPFLSWEPIVKGSLAFISARSLKLTLSVVFFLLGSELFRTLSFKLVTFFELVVGGFSPDGTFCPSALDFFYESVLAGSISPTISLGTTIGSMGASETSVLVWKDFSCLIVLS